ncbi:MAG: hypothetical protein ACI9MC_003287 [Kiritimatiellia bacterium]|jgi:hypothetical protein
MRHLFMLLALSACTAVASMGGAETDPGEVGFPSCVVTDTSSLTLSAEEPYGEITISIDLTDCVEPMAAFEGVDLDDPHGAFSITVPETPEIGPDTSVILGVTLEATEPGIYEAQVEIYTATFEEHSMRVQIFAEIL